MGTVHFILRDDEGRLVIEALAELPFKQVFELIGELNRQAVAGDGGGSGDGGGDRDGEGGVDGNHGDHHSSGAGRRYQIGRDQFELLLGAVAQLPYARVNRLLASLAQQLELDRSITA